PSSDVIRQITARAQGNPFYLEELLSYLRDRGVAPLDSSALWQVNLPTSLTSLVLSRVDQLPPTLQTTLKVASIIGRVLTVDWLWGVYPELGAAEQIYDHLDRLAQLGLTPVDSLEPELRYQFKHSIIQE